MELNFSAYNNQHKAKVIQLLGGSKFKRKLWDWQFLDKSRPKWDPVIVTNSEGELLGFNAVMPVTVRFDNKNIEAAWSCDFIVDSVCRGMGIGQKIKVQLHQHYSLLFALGISDQAVRVLKKMGWRSNTRVISYRKRKQSTDIKGFVVRIIQLYNQFRLVLSNASDSEQEYYTDYRLSSQLPEKKQVEQLLASILEGYDRTVIRDYEYLSWRYKHHPSACYNFISLWNNDSLIAIGVIRNQKNQSVLVDYIGPVSSFNLKLKLIEAWHDYSSAYAYMSCTSSDETLGEALIKSGFRATQKQRFYVYGDKQDCAENWFIMGGDSDGDILLAAQGVNLT
ncbi:MAG: hypothetical protein OQL19_16655 [Gammaproteobacteria bacterium]|nr:hypothetical protein [Gammaproteobacteria bacterium]